MATSPSIAGTSSISTLLRRDGILHLGAARVKRFELKQSLIPWRAIRSSAVARASTGEVAVAGNRIVEKGRDEGKVLKVGLICGGPSAERGISLNSARSVLDHLQVHAISFFIDQFYFVLVNSVLSLICF